MLVRIKMGLDLMGRIKRVAILVRNAIDLPLVMRANDGVTGTGPASLPLNTTLPELTLLPKASAATETSVLKNRGAAGSGSRSGAWQCALALVV